MALTAAEKAFFEENGYLGIEDEKLRLLVEAGKPKGTFRFLHISGKEYPGRV